VIIKAKFLEAIFDLSGQLFDQFGVVISEEEAIDLWHNLVEVAGDIVIWRNDPQIHQKIVESTGIMPLQFQDLLIDAYATDLASFAGWSTTVAANFLRGMDSDFRDLMNIYAGILSMGNEDLIISGFAQFAANLYGPQLGIDPSMYPALIEQAKNLLRISLLFIQDDYMLEIKRTIRFVNLGLLVRLIIYF
jgi:hypothetical protein